MQRFNATMAAHLPPDFAPDADPAVAWYAVLHLPYMLRFQGLRITTFAASIALSQRPEMHADADEGLRGALRFYDTAAGLIRDPQASLAPHPACVKLIADATRPEVFQAIDGFRAVAGQLVDQALARDATPEAYDAVLNHTYDVLAPAMEALVQRMAAADRMRTRETRGIAHGVRDDAARACAQIRSVARTVRIISINAGVEAAHAGAAGRAFSVIAGEIKALSEQTTAASAAIESAVGAITKRLDET